MTAPHSQNIASWAGKTIHDTAGQKIGKVGQLWADDASGAPSWVTVNTGLFGTSETFLPVQGVQPRGDDLQTSYDRDLVKDAPHVDPSGDHLDPGEISRLYQHYGLGTGQGQVGRTGTMGDTAADVGHDISGPTTDDAMTVSEERLRVGTQQVQTGRAALRKYVVTETQQVSVPVTHEEVRVEREPITEANVGAALDGPAISDEEHEMTLHAERPVVDTEAVPVERVRLAKEEVTEIETVSGEVRKERIDTDDLPENRPRR
ncbi:PRC and DUF2382 domain-containing protein [Amycolatopsis sp. NPDC023774]|uniref:PRC and DUF2382 domain-containing protein n=1 Tax=Amycolatopsis sp. NPDC023774 TaxID=3155015 RepID=UPI0033D43585